MIAEKFEVMAKLGILNSRMKDFYDIWMLSRQYDFEGVSLAEAIRQTFAQRGTTLVQMKEIFSGEFIDEKQVQWNAFRKRIGLEYLPASFADVVQQVQVFLSPAVEAHNRCFYFLIDSDKIFVTRMFRENFYRSVTPFISMVYSLSMILTR